MKILHSADWHLGAYVGPQCDDPMKRMENTIKCLDALVETARQEGPDIILVCGDLFHSAKVWSDRALIEVRTAADYLNVLLTIAPVHVLYGTPTHESLQAHYALEEMTKGFLDQVFFHNQPGIRTVSTKSGPIQIAGLPGFDKGHFRAQFPGLSAEEENQVFTQQLASIVQGLSAQLDPTIPSVLMAHHTVVGCELDNGTHVFQANEVVLDAATLDNSAFDLVCMGHIHKAQQVKACSKPVYYAGSIDAFTFNDEGHSKGFYIHNMMGGYAGRHYFIETPASDFQTYRWDEELTKTYVSKEWEGSFSDWYCDGKRIANCVVRILYTCDSETEKALDKKKLERDLYAAGAYYVSEIRPESITAAVNRERMTEKLTVEDCLCRYLDEKLGIDKNNVWDRVAIVDAAAPIIAEAQASSPMGASSGLFLPVEIEVRNYRSYAEEKLSFEDIFFAMVNGKNGSGKSSLFMDAITDCLYEETREGELTGWIRNGEKSGSISFTFMLGADTWRVTRTRQRSGKATLALGKGLLYFADYGDEKPGESGLMWEDHSCERLNDTQQKIIDLLGMDCDTFQSCVLIMQDRYGKFMEASKEDRMAVLANLLGLGIYDQLEEIAKAKLTEVNRKIRTLKGDIESLEAEVGVEDNLHTELLQIQTELSVASDDLAADKLSLSELYEKLGAIDGYVREAAELEKEVKAKTDSYTEKKNRKVDLQGRVTETETFLQNEGIILEKCVELDTARLEIAALDGKVQLLNDKRIRCSKVNRDILTAQQYRANTEKTLEAIAESLKDRERLEGIVNGSTVEQELEECEREASLFREYDNALRDRESALKDFIRTTTAEVSNRRFKLDSLMKQVDMLNDSNCIDVEKAGCRFLQSAKKAREEAVELKHSIDNYLGERELQENQIRQNIEELKNIISGIQYNPDIHNKLIQDAKTYREAKDKLSKLAANAATADTLKKQDAETAAKIEELESELQVLSGEIAELEKGTNCITELNSKVRDLARYENMKMQLPKAKQFVESSTETIKQLDADIAELVTSISNANIRLGKLSELTAGQNDIRRAAYSLEAAIKAIEASISNLNQRIGTIQAQLLVIENKKSVLSTSQIGLQQAAREAAQLQVLSEAFSQDGIPYQIIRDIVPELEAAANEILGQMTGGRMRLEFVTEKVLKSNKAKEIATLEIIITDVDNGTLPYLSRSGGQKVRAALANSFALAMIKASRVGLQLGMLFIDEPSFLDADGIEGYCAALETIHNRYPEMRIMAISHDENMKSRFPQQLYVDVTENGSKVRRL